MDGMLVQSCGEMGIEMMKSTIEIYVARIASFPR